MKIDYLAVGHISVDITPQDARPGGSVLYASTTAYSLGVRAALVTTYKSEHDDFVRFPRKVLYSSETTTFAIDERDGRRALRLMARATSIPADVEIPQTWGTPEIVHLAPIAQELAPEIVRRFAGRFIGVTPQGWMRRWDEDGVIYPAEWESAAEVLKFATAAVLSDEDLPSGYDPAALAELVPVLVVTYGERGATLYWERDTFHIAAPKTAAVDSTGAGDIFAAAFFIRLYHTRDPIEAARFATVLAADSVTRPGLAGVPSPERIRAILRA